MKSRNSCFNGHEVLLELKHYLPAQAPLKDFIHHNPLHAFQQDNFYEGRQKAAEMLGYQVSLSLNEFREYYEAGRINKKVLERIIIQKKGAEHVNEWLEKAISKTYPPQPLPRIGSLRAFWKRQYQIDLDSLVHPTLFRILSSFLDQGIALWPFPVQNQPFLAAIRDMERNSFTSFFRTERAKNLLLYTKCDISELLQILVGDESLYTHYLFDQQFAHQGWSGMVVTIEDQPELGLHTKPISLHDVILFELLLEIDALDFSFGDIWAPLGTKVQKKPRDLFAPIPKTELWELMAIWQEAFEWSYYDDVLAGISLYGEPEEPHQTSFQAMFCLDNRETSLRQYLEQTDTACETFGTPGFFNVETYYKPAPSRFHLKLCPAPLTPRYLIKESGAASHHTKDTHGLIRKTLGFWSAIKALIHFFYPVLNPTTTSSLRRMGTSSRLTIENDSSDALQAGLQVGFTISEMAQRVRELLNCAGLVGNFAPIVYLVGHGSSSINSSYYAAYNCSACCGRPGSVNARAFASMANHAAVRKILRATGIDLPDTTQFLAGLHDTACDEIAFYDLEILSPENQARHQKNLTAFDRALELHAKEQTRHLVFINSRLSPKSTPNKLRRQIVSRFEPRPELTHATNALCIIGRRTLTQNLYLNRRAFLNSFDYRVDPTGQYLLDTLKAVLPICGGINLEYFFSRVDNQKLGAGTLLPHNVMGLFGVANGADGDLRPGLPSQMIEVHDPLRLLMVVEHFPEVVLEAVKALPTAHEWFLTEWIHLAVIHPETQVLSVFRQGTFYEYIPIQSKLESVTDLMPIRETCQGALPVYVFPSGNKHSRTEEQQVVLA